MKKKTPQKKKALSYAKDCRNTYGENRKIAIENCKRLAGYVFLEQIGAVEMVTVNENYISVITN